MRSNTDLPDVAFGVRQRPRKDGEGGQDRMKSELRKEAVKILQWLDLWRRGRHFTGFTSQ